MPLAMLLNYAHIENYSIHRESSLALEPVTVLIGRNGGGKSTLLEALLLLGRFARGAVPAAFTDSGPYSYRARLFHGAADSEPMRFEVRFAPGEGAGQVTYRLEIGLENDVPVVQRELVSTEEYGTLFDRDSGEFAAPHGLGAVGADQTVIATARAAPSEARSSEQVRLLRTCSFALGRVLRFRFDPFAIGGLGGVYPDDEEADPREPDLGFRGENTAGFLYWLRDFRNRVFRELQTAMAELVPGFGTFEFNTARPDPDKVEFSIRFSDDRGLVASRNLSAGTLMMVALVCVTKLRGRGTPPRPKVICVEEPELGLTPAATRAIFDRLTALRDDSQLVVTSHSAHLWHPAMGQASTTVLRVIPRDGCSTIETVRDAILREEGPAGFTKLAQGGGMGIEQALRTMEGLG
ncbi:MAG: AAA family ATPase [Solirubrobacteraceae bacterium]